MKKEGKRKNKLFSPRNILIFFIIVIILLLTLNYFYPISSINNLLLDRNSNTAELYQTIRPDSGDDKDCGGKICGKCERCVFSPDKNNFFKPTCIGVDMDNPNCGYPGVCGKTCGNDPCERCVRYDVKDKNGETITISKCLMDAVGECKDKREKTACGDNYCDMFCETCINNKCIPKKGNIICYDRYHCGNYNCPNPNDDWDDPQCDNRYGRAKCSAPSEYCRLNCGQCAVCTNLFFYSDSPNIPRFFFEERCFAVKDNIYSCKKTGSNDYKGVCMGGKCE